MHIVGTQNPDTLTGTSAADLIEGLGGNDSIEGGNGADEIHGGSGDDTIYGNTLLLSGALLDPQSPVDGIDTIYGEDGDDIIFGNQGNDILSGGADNDLIVGGRQSDTLSGDDGDDIIYGDGNVANDTAAQFGNDTIEGGNGADEIHGGSGNDTIYGNTLLLNGALQNFTTPVDGDDTIYGEDGNDIIYGNQGNDILSGGAGVDRIVGGRQSDTLSGDDGNDTIYGDGEVANDTAVQFGNDIIEGGNGADEIHGGSGNDIIYGNTFLLNGALQNFTTPVDGNDTIFGDDGDDIIYGNQGGDILHGGAGDDLIIGGRQSDTLYGEDGDDRMYGDANGDDTAQSGNDTLHGGAGFDQLEGNEGDDTLYGDDGNDYLNGGIGFDHLYGGDGMDMLFGLEDNDTMFGGAGIDFLYGWTGSDELNGDDGDDQLFGDDGDDVIHGDADNDVLYGWIGIDRLYGGVGNDLLSGEQDGDILDGGAGTDTLFGGTGDDRFVFALGYGADTIADFAAGANTDDKIDLTAFADIHTLTDVLIRTTQVGADVVIDFGNGDRLTLQNVNKANLNIDDFVGLANKTPGDLGGDSKSDLLFVNNTSHDLAAWQIDGTQVAAAAQIGTINAAGGWHYSDRADFNGDGRTDLLFLDDANHGVAIWQMNGTQIETAAQVGTINAAAGWSYRNSGDFDGDGKSDLLFLNDTTHGVAIWQMNGTQVASAAQVGTINAAGGWFFSSVGDFNGDSKTDLLLLNETTHGVAVWQMNGTQATSAVQVGTIDATGGWRFADTGDFNSDGKTDLLLLNDTTHGVAIWQMNGTQATSAAQVGTINAADGWHFADTGDYNGDGNTDLLFFNDTTHGVAVWQMNGTQIAAAAQVGTVNAAGGWSYSGAGDFNGDGKTDLLFESSTSHGIAVWEMNGTQILAAAQIGTVNAAADWHLIS